MDNGVSIQDIFAFLATFFSPPPANALADINGDGRVTVQDIFDFLSGFFFGCS